MTPRIAFGVAHRGVFFPATARSIVLGWMLRSNFCRTSLASSRARTGSPATSCCWTNARASPRNLCGPRGPRFCGASPAMPALSKLARISHRVWPGGRGAARSPKTTYTSVTCIMPRGWRTSRGPSEHIGRMSFCGAEQGSTCPTGLAKIFQLTVEAAPPRRLQAVVHQAR